MGNYFDGMGRDVSGYVEGLELQIKAIQKQPAIDPQYVKNLETKNAEQTLSIAGLETKVENLEKQLEKEKAKRKVKQENADT